MCLLVQMLVTIDVQTKDFTGHRMYVPVVATANVQILFDFLTKSLDPKAPRSHHPRKRMNAVSFIVFISFVSCSKGLSSLVRSKDPLHWNVRRYRRGLLATSAERSSLQCHHRYESRLSAVSESDADSRKLGISVLLTVPFAWGTFEPTVRYVYEIGPPIPPILFSLGYYFVAAMSLTLLTMISKQERNNTNWDNSLPIRGGLELGTYLFVGNGFQVLGLKTVAADRAAFLLQLTTLFVPLVQGVMNGDLRSISRKTWTACCIALLGVAVISLDGKEGTLAENAANILTNFSQGDFLIMAAAFSYTFHCIRLEVFARETSADQLAACKATTETIWTLLLLCSTFVTSDYLSSAQAATKEITSFIDSDLLSNPALPNAAIAILWTGLVAVAYTIYAQSFGQSRVSPTDANLIYTTQPIWTSLFAWVLLGETLGPLGCAGGALIGVAVYLVTADSSDDADKVQ